MSRTTLFAAFADGDLVEVAEFKNAWGSAMFVWETLCDRYSIDGSFHGPDSKYSKLWAGDEDGSLSLRPWERNALRSTYDRALVMSEAMSSLANSMDRFAREHDDGTKVCHMRAQAAAIREAHENGARAIAWQQTSCGDDHWYSEAACESCGCTCSGERWPYNIDKRRDHVVFDYHQWPESEVGS